MKKLILPAAFSHPRFSGKTISISEESAIKPSLPFFNSNTSTSRCYATINFVSDSSYEKKTPYGVPLEEFPPERAARQHSLLFSSREVPIAQKHKFSVPSGPSKDEDAFAELGLPVAQGGESGSKFMSKTHKSSPNLATSGQPLDTPLERCRRLASKLNLSQRKNPSLKISPKPDYHRPVFSFKSEDCNGVSAAKNETKCRKWLPERGPNHKITSFITVEEIPSSITLTELKEAASVYGNILSASMRIGQNGLNICDIEFESVESMERALVAQSVAVRKFHLPIRSLHAPKVVTVRISNISLETSEPTIHSVCTRCGSVEGLLRMKEGAVDVLFCVRDSSVAETILKKLNDVLIDDCKWSAQFLSQSTPNSVTNVVEVKRGVGSEIISVIGRFRKQLEMKKIYLEDLEELHQAVVHIRDCPTGNHL